MYILLLSLIAAKNVMDTATMVFVSQDMSNILIPLTRNELTGQKIQHEEEQLRAVIDSTIELIYNDVVDDVKETDNTSHSYVICDGLITDYQRIRLTQRFKVTIIEENESIIPDVIDGLRLLFPDSKVNQGTVEPTAGQTFKTIVVDWSEYSLAIKLTQPSRMAAMSQDMSLIPITRDELKQLKISADEEKRKTEIACAIKELYDMVVQRASGSGDTTMQFTVIEDANMGRMNAQQIQKYRQSLHQQLSQTSTVIITENLRGDVISGLRELFPDSKIAYNVAVMARAPDGKMYDVTKMDSAPFSPLFRTSQTTTTKVINIDWS